MTKPRSSRRPAPARPLRLLLAPLAVLTLLALPLPAPAQDHDALVATGNRLAALLRAGRAVVSANQDRINDASVGDKGLTPDVFMDQVIAAYLETNGEPPLTDDLTDLQRRLTQAQLDAMRAVVAEQQQVINMEGMGFKGFIPAVFARLVNERFGETVGDLANVKVTAPPDLVRNRTARPDAWEAEVIETRFGAVDHEKGAPWFEVVDGADFRMLIPEYYSASCLSCHGGPAGEVDVTGFPKEGGTEGELGGAISIILHDAQ
ncbi:c-type heme family protein [Psychromarinibacter sp. S121]|uniref:c-type heme family protein n=1 Tax=Psychromarinibacter sp. S121 TaxID=3415127 RepID=UPI003C7CAAFC